MLSKIKSFIDRDHKDRVLHDKRFKVVKTDNKYKFIPIRNNTSLTLRIGEKELDLDDEMEFSRDITQNENICVLSHKKPEFYLGNNYSDKSVDIFFNRDQIKNLESIKFSDQNIFSDSTDYSYRVSKIEDIWCISVTGILEKLPHKVDINLGFGYPSIQISDDQNIANHDYNLYNIDKKEINVNIPNNLKGKILIGDETFNLCKYRRNKHCLSDISYNKIYVFDGEIEDRIEKWNNQSISVTLMPKNYVPIQKTEELNKELTKINFNISEFDELGEIKARYPIDLDVNPRISYHKPDCDLDIVPDGIQRSIYDQYVSRKESDDEQVFTFKSVIPSERLTVMHTSSGCGFGSKFDGFGKSLEVRSGDKKDVYVKPEPRKIHFRVENDTKNPVTVNINENTEYINPDESVKIEANLRDEKNKIELRDSSGDVIESKTLDKYEAMALSETTVTTF